MVRDRPGGGDGGVGGGSGGGGGGGDCRDDIGGGGDCRDDVGGDSETAFPVGRDAVDGVFFFIYVNNGNERTGGALRVVPTGLWGAITIRRCPGPLRCVRDRDDC